MGRILDPTGRPARRGIIRPGGYFTVECRDRYGRLKWRRRSHNLVVNAGLTYQEGVAFLGVTQITTWYLLLTAGTPVFAAADTMASHGGWTEVTAYSQGVRPTWTGAAGAAGASSNSASPASVTANAGGTVGGCALTSNNTKGGTTGTLAGGAAFSGGNTTFANGDTITATYNHSVADDGV